MKKILFLIFPLLGVWACNSTPLSSDAPNDNGDTVETASALYDAKPTKPNGLEIPRKLQGADGKILRRVGYTCSYNARNRIPNWVAWHLTASHVGGH